MQKRKESVKRQSPLSRNAMREWSRAELEQSSSTLVIAEEICLQQSNSGKKWYGVPKMHLFINHYGAGSIIFKCCKLPYWRKACKGQLLDNGEFLPQLCR